MTTPTGAYVAPTYTALLPSGDTVCSLCGAAVLRAGVHDEWHAALWAALSRTSSSAESGAS